MAESMINARANSGDEKQFKAESDPFYSDENMQVLKRSIKQLDTGNGKEHDLVEVNE